jgi:DNA-binding response OmpR family regulator
MAHILSVEEEPYFARLLTIGLQQVGHTSSVIHDGSEVFIYVRDHPPDLILLDVMLPGMDGFQVLKQLKRHPVTRRVPVLMLTGLVDGQAVIPALDSGADVYLSKPVDIPDLLNRITVVLGRANERA